MLHDVISIVSGGYSASQVDLKRVPGTVIAVNNAMLHAPKVDHAISMDRRWAEAHWAWLKERGDAGKLRAWLRPNNVIRIPDRPHWLTVYACDHRSHEMSDHPNTLNGTNSGGVALNLAYSFKPKKVYLFGFDYRRGPKGQFHWFQPRADTGVVGAFTIDERRYASWASQFEVAGRQFRAAGIDVVNVSDTTVVAAFRKMHPKEFMGSLA